jgi:hypothetical protein
MEQKETRTAWIATKNYDDTVTDTAVWHTQQILAELIQPGSRTIHSGTIQLINPV